MKPVLLPDSGDVTDEQAKRLRHHSESDHSGAQQKAQHFGPSNGIDDELDRLIELWPMLSSDDRAALLAHAEHLVALRDGATGETSFR